VSTLYGRDGEGGRTTSRARDAVCSSRVRRSVGPRSAPTACACPPAARGHALATAQMPPAPRAALPRGAGGWARAGGVGRGGGQAPGSR
jgi:hypothetical protein